VQCTYFLGKDTIDEDIYKIIESKRKISNIITGSVDNVQREIIEQDNEDAQF
jgi:SWI/SNF-related matrix-associated actin-dependent regulator 1 of chromatin subfamily A